MKERNQLYKKLLHAKQRSIVILIDIIDLLLCLGLASELEISHSLKDYTAHQIDSEG